MDKEAFQLNDTAVTLYEDQKVTSMFGPLACATLDAVEISKTDVILDVACGTGIVSREIYAKISPTAPITGTDLNAGMIAMARKVTQDKPEVFQWHVADIENLPLETGQFTKVFCQQGIQYFPNEATALTEMRRVIQTGGTANNDSLGRGQRLFHRNGQIRFKTCQSGGRQKVSGTIFLQEHR